MATWKEGLSCDLADFVHMVILKSSVSADFALLELVSLVCNLCLICLVK